MPIALPDSNGSAPTEEPPFDLETAIRVCRQAGYFEHAVWLAERYGEHQEYLRIQIEDRSDYQGSLKYLRKLGAHAAEDNLLRYGKKLLAAQPRDTTALLIDLCCGTLEREDDDEAEAQKTASNRRKSQADKSYLSYLAYAIPSSGAPDASASLPDMPASPLPTGAVPRTVVSNLRAGAASESAAANRRSGIYPQYQVPDSAPPSESDHSAQLPSPRQFFAIFVEHPDEFITFLETVASRRYGKSLGAVPTTLDAQTAPLPEPQPLRQLELDDDDTRNEQAIWNTLLELYLTHSSTPTADGASTAVQAPHSKAVLEAKALQLLRSRERIQYDETQALLVCTTAGFTAGFVLLYEQLGMYDDIVRYLIDSSAATSSDSAKVIHALRRYGEASPHLYRMVLRYLTTSSELLSRHQNDIVDILDVIDREGIMPPIAVVQILSTNGTASIGLVREYLKRQLGKEKQEIDSVRPLYKCPGRRPDPHLSSGPRPHQLVPIRERQEAQGDPGALRPERAPHLPGHPLLRVRRPTRPPRRALHVPPLVPPAVRLSLINACVLPSHAWSCRCLAENESQCPNCARTHGVIREIRKNNEQLAGRHDLFAEEVRESEDGYATVAAAFGKGLMGLAAGEERGT